MQPSFQAAICECPDISGSTLAVDVTGRYAMVCGRKCMGLIDLGTDNGNDSNSSNIDGTQTIDNDSTQALSGQNTALTYKRLSRNSKYDPTASHFSRLSADLFALTTYQVVEIFSIGNLNPAKPKIVLRGHSRAIADVEWSNFDPFLLGSSAADCITNLWDIRDARRPSNSLISVSGATQIRFSKTSDNLIATSHDIDVRIWDIRQPNLPLYYIAAHLQKINGMDWINNKHSCENEQLITCSQDSTIKLWDITANKIRPGANLTTRIPAWRIRYTPVSPHAVVTSTLPQLRSRNECMTLKLWSMKPNRYEQKRLEMVLGLVGHTDVIVDFDWRQTGSQGACEIVSWSKDQTMRVWRIDNQFIEMNVDNSDFEAECDTQTTTCESSITTSSVADSLSTVKNSSRIDSPNAALKSTIVNRSLSTLPSADAPSESLAYEHNNTLNLDDSEIDELSSESISAMNELKQEFNLINKSIPNIEFEELNSLRRVCLVTARAKTVSCRLRIALPPNYPQSECPTFTIIDSNQHGCDSLSKESKEKLLNLLNETAKSQLSRSRNCLEPCLRKFIVALQKLTSHSSFRRRGVVGSSSDYKDDPITLSAQRDHSVPFPPTSGARFCGNLLVCFGRPIISTTLSKSNGELANWQVETPRSMAQLSAQLDNMRRQGSYNLSHISISYFYYGAMKRAEMQSRSNKANLANNTSRTSSKYLLSRNKGSLGSQSIMSRNYKCGPVYVYDVSNMLGGISKELAEDYVFDMDVIKMCRQNAEIAAKHNRRDLVQIWCLAELSSEGVLHSYLANKDGNLLPLINYAADFGDRPWTMHPFGSKLIQSLIDHYVNNCRDVQTAAMLVWTFTSYEHKSSSNAIDRLPKLNILSTERSLQNDLIMHIYAELLYRLNLLNQRAMVLKNIGSNWAYWEIFGDKQQTLEAPEQRLPDLHIQCCNDDCGNKCQSAQCANCKKYSLNCSICRLPVRGSCSMCLICLHGGHINHWFDWFEDFDFCPTGCGCKCLHAGFG